MAQGEACQRAGMLLLRIRSMHVVRFMALYARQLILEFVQRFHFNSWPVLEPAKLKLCCEVPNKDQVCAPESKPSMMGQSQPDGVRPRTDLNLRQSINHREYD